MTNLNFQVNTYTAQAHDLSHPSATGLSDGNFVVTWQSPGQDGTYYSIYGQRYDSSGVAAGDEFKINTYGNTVGYNGYQMKPSVASLSDGSFVVTWESHNQDGDSYGIYGQRYDSSGAAAGDEFKINTYTSGTQQHSEVASLSDGGFVVTWMSMDSRADMRDIYGQRYDSSGAAAGNEFQVNSYTMQNQMDPAVAGLSDGSFVVTWESYNQDGDFYGIYGQRYDSSGAAAGVEFQVNSYTTQGQGGPAVAGLSDGSFVVTWSSDGQDGSSNGIYGQRYDSSGAAAGDEFKINTYTTSSQEFSSVTSIKSPVCLSAS